MHKTKSQKHRLLSWWSAAIALITAVWLATHVGRQMPANVWVALTLAAAFGGAGHFLHLPNKAR